MHVSSWRSGVDWTLTFDGPHGECLLRAGHDVLARRRNTQGNDGVRGTLQYYNNNIHVIMIVHNDVMATVIQIMTTVTDLTSSSSTDTHTHAAI